MNIFVTQFVNVLATSPYIDCGCLLQYVVQKYQILPSNLKTPYIAMESAYYHNVFKKISPLVGGEEIKNTDNPHFYFHSTLSVQKHCQMMSEVNPVVTSKCYQLLGLRIVPLTVWAAGK